MPERIAKAEQEYAGRVVKAGQRFEVEESHVALLLSIGRLEPVKGEPGYVARELSANEPTGYRTREIKKKKRFG